MPKYGGAGQEQHGADGETRECLISSVPVRVLVIRRLAGEPKAGVDDGGRENVTDRFQTVGDNGAGTGVNTDPKDKTFITIYLMSGVKLSGRIKSFDKYSVILEANNQEQLIFKHAISTVVVSRPLHGGGHGSSGGSTPGAPLPLPEQSENN